MTIWYPSPGAFDDLTVTDTEQGFELSAPDGTECADWLGYYNSTEELHEEFEREFVAMLTEHARRLEADGSKEQDAERGQAPREQAQDDQHRPVEQH